MVHLNNFCHVHELNLANIYNSKILETYQQKIKLKILKLKNIFKMLGTRTEHFNLIADNTVTHLMSSSTSSAQ